MVKNNKEYNPVTAHVPGIDEKLKSEILHELSLVGDPDPHGNSEKPEQIQKPKKKFWLKIFK